jgi:hypothetical protein
MARADMRPRNLSGEISRDKALYNFRWSKFNREDNTNDD